MKSIIIITIQKGEDMANEDVKRILRKNGVYHYQVADALGLQDSAFSRLLRKDLTEEKKREIYAAVERLTGGDVDEKK